MDTAHEMRYVVFSFTYRKMFAALSVNFSQNRVQSKCLYH